MTRRSAEVRLDTLLRTARDVILERGLPHTRAGDVASAAGVSQALVFYHFETKGRLLAQAFAYAAEQDLVKLGEIMTSRAKPLAKLRQFLRCYTPTADDKAWALWIDGWAEAMRVPELEEVSRRLDLRWKEALQELIAAGIADGTFSCVDPKAAAWRLIALIDGLAVQLTVHKNMISRRTAHGWIRTAVANELGIDATLLS